ncbi:hypothetical protein PMAYCL1PPCAC_02986, partial [Pristionchus mayeri]
PHHNFRLLSIASEALIQGLVVALVVTGIEGSEDGEHLDEVECPRLLVLESDQSHRSGSEYTERLEFVGVITVHGAKD